MKAKRVLGVFFVSVAMISIFIAADIRGGRKSGLIARKQSVSPAVLNLRSSSRSAKRAPVSETQSQIGDVRPMPGARLTGAVKTLIGAKTTYRTARSVAEVGLYYLDELPKTHALVRSVAGPSGVFWFGEFKDDAGTKIFVTARADRMSADSSDHGFTELSIVRIGTTGD